MISYEWFFTYYVIDMFTFTFTTAYNSINALFIQKITLFNCAYYCLLRIAWNGWLLVFYVEIWFFGERVGIMIQQICSCIFLWWVPTSSCDPVNFCSLILLLLVRNEFKITESIMVALWILRSSMKILNFEKCSIKKKKKKRWSNNVWIYKLSITNMIYKTTLPFDVSNSTKFYV